MARKHKATGLAAWIEANICLPQGLSAQPGPRRRPIVETWCEEGELVADHAYSDLRRTKGDWPGHPAGAVQLAPRS